MRTFEWNGTTYEVEDKTMGSSELHLAFVDESDFSSVYDWATNADLSRIELTGVDDEEDKVYEGYTELSAVTALFANEFDFWEGVRMVAVFEKPMENDM